MWVAEDHAAVGSRTPADMCAADFAAWVRCRSLSFGSDVVKLSYVRIGWAGAIVVTLALSACGFERDRIDVQERSLLPEPAALATSAGRALDSTLLTSISRHEIDGFVRVRGNVSRGVASAYYEADSANDQGVTISVMVSAKRCAICRETNADEWREDRSSLLSRLPRVHAENPDLVFEIDEISVAGKTAIVTYERSYLANTRATSTAHALTLYYNNRVNQVVLFVSATGINSTIASSADLEAALSKDEMAAAAESIFAEIAPSL